MKIHLAGIQSGFFPSSNIKYKITINGNINRNGNLSVTGSGKLTIKDTLIIYGDLYVGEENELTIEDNAILIVFGNLHLDEEAKVKANDYFIVTGNIIRSGDHDEGSFKSNDNPVKVFIGGSIPSNITNNNSRYTALNCSNPPTLPYLNSTCSYGNILDLLEDPIYSFYKTLCPATTPATISASGPTSFCEGGNVLLTASSGIAFSWSNGANTQSIEVLTSGTFTVNTINSIGCQSTISNATDILVHPLPSKPIINSSGPLSFCEGASVTLSTENGSKYSWSNGGTSQSINVSISDSFKVMVTDEHGCISPESNRVITSVLPTPPKPTVSLSGPSTLCEGESIILTSSPEKSW